MRLVIDTNVLVSGLLFPHGPPGRIVDLVVAGRFVPLFDDRILHEYRDVLRRDRFPFAPGDVRDVLAQLRTTGEHVTAEPWSGALPDPGDRPFLEVAITGRARGLVTGNRRDYEPREGSHSVDVVSPHRMLERETGTGDPPGPPA